MIGIVAKLKVKAGSEAAFESITKELIELSRQEPGCLEYGLWRTEQAGLYVFVERYKDESAIEAHAKSDHFRRIARQFREMLDGPLEITKLFPV